MKKNPFLLLEVLIAFTLVTLCIVPLVRQPLQLYRTELAYLEEMELERLAEWAFTEAKEILLKNEIPWAKIPHKGEVAGPFPLSPTTLNIPGCPGKIIERSFLLKGRGEKPGPNGAQYRQLGVCIFLGTHKYWFRLPVQLILKVTNNDLNRDNRENQ